MTHGDADHFAGLPEIFKSETNKEIESASSSSRSGTTTTASSNAPSKKNGKSVPDVELLGATRKVGNQTFLTGLEDDLLKVPDAEMNAPFKEWKDALKEYNKRAKIEFRRLQFGDDARLLILQPGRPPH